MDAFTHFSIILLESGSFLLLGALTAGLLDAFLSPADVARLLPSRALPAALTGSLLGFIFPAGATGSIAVARWLRSKGAAPALSMAYLLSAPVLNLVTLAALAALLGETDGTLVWLAVLTVWALAMSAGLLFALHPAPETFNRAPALPQPDRLPLGAGLRHALRVARHEIIVLGRALVLGAALAAAISLLVTTGDLDADTHGSAESVVALLALGFAHGGGPLAITHAAADLVPQFSAGAVLGWLVIGSSANLTQVLVLLTVFRSRIVTVLVALVALSVALVALWLTLNTTL